MSRYEVEVSFTVEATGASKVAAENMIRYYFDHTVAERMVKDYAHRPVKLVMMTEPTLRMMEGF